MKKIAGLLLVAFAVYIFSFGNEFLWDDEQFIVENAYVQNLHTWPEYFSTSTTAGAGIVSNYYRPLTTLSFAVDYALWGPNPFGFHVTNTLLHAIGGVLVYLLLRKMLQVYAHDNSLDLVAYLTAFAFVLHPAQVEAVVYMNSRGDSLSLVYGVTSVLLLIKVLTEKSENTRILLGCAAFLSYLISLLTKETGMVWLCVFSLYLFALVQHTKKVRIGMYVVLALELISTAVYFLLRFTTLQFQSTAEIWGTTNVYANSLLVRLGTFMFNAIPQYLAILVWPTGLHMERDVPVIQHLQEVPVTGAVVVVMLMSAIVGYSIYLLKKKNRFPHPFLLGTVLFIVLLAPFSGVVPLNGILYEHWLYAPMIGWWLACFFLLHKLLPRKYFLVLVSTIFVAWGVLSMKQILVWRSPLTLYPHILKYAETARIRMNLGMGYAERNEVDKAIPEYQRAVELSDQYPQTHHNLGNAYVELQQYDKAEQEYIKALEIDPTFRFSLSALIQLEIALKKKAEAEKWAAYALEKLPGDPTFISLSQRVQSTQW